MYGAGCAGWTVYGKFEIRLMLTCVCPAVIITGYVSLSVEQAQIFRNTGLSAVCLPLGKSYIAWAVLFFYFLCQVS
jgi:hypothetical protein